MNIAHQNKAEHLGGSKIHKKIFGRMLNGVWFSGQVVVWLDVLVRFGFDFLYYGVGEKRLNHSGRMTRKWNGWLVFVYIYFILGGKVSENRYFGGVVFFEGTIWKGGFKWVNGFCINWFQDECWFGFTNKK